MSTIEIKVPDIGDYKNVPVIELLVKPGDVIKKDQGLLTLESDKATLEVPASHAGTIQSLKVKVGDVVSTGHIIAVLTLSEVEKQSAVKTDVSKQSTTNITPDDQLNNGQSINARKQSADIACQILVLGAGPGGYTAAFRAADLGQSVVLVERYDSLGGVCLNVGCIPSKALLHTAKLLDECVHAETFGIQFGKPKVDLKRLQSYKNGVVKKLTQGLAGMAKQRQVQRVTGIGRFISEHEVEVSGAEGKKRIYFEKAIIAVGSQAVKLQGFPWSDPRIMDSTDALMLRDIPKSLLIVGGGIIGLEMACVYGALGSKITVVELADQLMPGADIDLVKPLEVILRKRYQNIYLKTKVTNLDAQKAGLQATFIGADATTTPKAQVFDRVLCAVGRAPNGKKVDAELAGVKVDEQGFIAVDQQQRTNVPHIFAIGDVVGQPMLAHKATHEAKVAAEVASGIDNAMITRLIPSVAYTDPEIAWVGMTENEAKAQNIAYRVGKFPWAASGRAIGINRTEGFTKLLFSEQDHCLIGAGIVGPHAGDLIAETGLAIEMRCDAVDIGRTIHPHPTLAETINMAAEVYEGTITDLFIPKRK